jgi:hypothetical protein
MAELKTKPEKRDPLDFINSVDDGQKRKDSLEILKMMKEITGKPPVMWGPSMIGFDQYHYKYKSGHEGDAFVTGFSPRKTSLVLYVLAGFERLPELLQKLGKYKNGKSCLYVKRLSDIDKDVLRELIIESVKYMKKRWP